MFDFLPAPLAVAGDPAAAIVILFALLIAHAVCDFALQSDFLARAKNRNADLSPIFGDKEIPRGLWANALSAHCLIHAGGVWLVTGSVGLAALEFIIHCFVDFAKCEGWISFSTDQILHRACKIFYAAILYVGPAWITWSPV